MVKYKSHDRTASAGMEDGMIVGLGILDPAQCGHIMVGACLVFLNLGTGLVDVTLY